MNFPNATESEWAAARDIIFTGACRAGYDESAADDIAQNAIGRMMVRTFANVPDGPEHAAKCVVKWCRARGMWQAFTDRGMSRRPVDEARAVRNRGGFPSDPQWLAERAESMTRADRVKAMTKVCPADSMLAVCIAAAGIGPGACIHEVGHSPSVYGAGPGHDMPSRGLPGLHLFADPNSARSVAARQEPTTPLEGENLAAYRSQLAAYYG